MKLLAFCAFYALLTLVSGAGLNEEFTWTRISYAWPKGRISRRQSGSYAGHKAESDAIVFEGSTNGDQDPKQVKGPGNIDYQYGKFFTLLINLFQFFCHLQNYKNVVI